MFTSTGLFRNIACPHLQDCTLPNCIFSHEQVFVAKVNDVIYDPTLAGESDAVEPPSKRRRLVSPNKKTDEVSEPTPIQDPARQERQPIKTPLLHEQIKSKQANDVVKAISLTREVSPPPKKQVKHHFLVEKLIPRQVPRAPAVLKTRLSLVELLHKHMKSLNQDVAAKDSSDQLLLSDQELIHLTLNEEEQAALKFGSDIYRNAMSQTVLRFKKLSSDDWCKYVKEYRQRQKPAKVAPQIVDKASGTQDFSINMSSAHEIMVLLQMQTKLEGLESHGYVTHLPSSGEVVIAKAAVSTSGGYEVCDRCGTRFQCFPGRNNHGELTTRGACHYHWGKINRSQSNKNARMYGQADAYYPCCNQPAGSEGCTTAKTHVFKVTDIKRLASTLQFEITPPNRNVTRIAPVAFDCEMGYTTYGLELIRITAITWPEKKDLLDVLVRPYGEILDLNTRFSGVTQEQFSTAPAYKVPASNDQSLNSGNAAEPKLLQKVESPAAARQLLFERLTPETPLIGHAIDNDLNACRIIHPFVVDTVLLYPHPRGLPIRYGLKMLAAKYLDRAIQTGGAQGHDSKEDSVATGDLARVKVAERWAQMKLEGWSFDSGSLTPPSSVTVLKDAISEN